MTAKNPLRHCTVALVASLALAAAVSPVADAQSKYIKEANTKFAMTAEPGAAQFGAGQLGLLPVSGR